MVPVEQRKLWRPEDHPDGPQRGDCVRCCIASIFEVSYEEVEDIGASIQDASRWVKERFPALTIVHRDIRHPIPDVEEIGEHINWPTSCWNPGYWIATVWSPRIPDEEVFGCGCGADPDCQWCHGEPEKRKHPPRLGLHAVVMENGGLAFDPHPEREADPTLYFYGAAVIHVGNPALLSPFSVSST